MAYYDDYSYDDNYYKKTLIKPNTIRSSMALNPVVEYYKKIYSVRKLPNSPLDTNYSATERGFFDLSKAFSLNSEQDIYGNQKQNYHEKAWPERIGILKSDGKVVPHYFREFDMQGEMHNAVSKINANLVCGRLFPTPMKYYAGFYNGKFGTVGIDLNNISGVKSLRLDKYLESKGIEFDSISCMIKAYNSGVFKEDLTSSAISQLMLSMFSLPNAIGEQDPNTRNAILLGPEGKNTKFDSLVRIDFENNRIMSSPNQKSSFEHTGDLVRVYPFGMYGRDENKFELKEGIEKAVKDGELTRQDCNLVLCLNDLTRQATRRTNVSNALSDAETSHSFKNEDGREVLCCRGDFSYENLDSIGESLITRADNYCDRLQDYFKDAGVSSHDFNLPNLNQE